MSRSSTSVSERATGDALNSRHHPQSHESLTARYGSRHRWQVLGVVAIGFMAGILPSGSFVVAIPALLQTFHAGQRGGQLVMTTFMVANTIAMLPTPWLIGRYGLRTCFLWTMALLTLTSVLGALSPSLGFLVVIRALQGAGTGTIMPMSSIVIMRHFQPRHRGHAAGIMGLAVTLAPAVAPTIGGLMVDHWGWRSVSLMPLPFCVLAWVAAVRFLPVGHEADRHGFDGRGMALLSLLTLGWLGTVSNIAAQGWARGWLLAFFLLLLLSMAAFVDHARRHHKPLIGLEVLGIHRVRMGAVVAFVLGFYSYGAAYLVPVYFQVAMGLSATRAGAALMPGTLALALSSPVAGFLHEYFSPRQIMTGGMLILAVSWLVLGGFAASLSYLAFILVLLVSRVGFAFANTPMNQAALANLNGDLLGQAAAVLGYTRQLGGVFGIAALAGFVAWRGAQLGGGGLIEIPAYAEAFLIVAVTAGASLAAVWRL